MRPICSTCLCLLGLVICGETRPIEAQTRPATQPVSPGLRLAGFEISPHFGEQVKSYTFDPEVHVHINAPAPENYDARRPTRLVVYALPNGNTIAQTIGRNTQDGIDWHFNIQHIGAQTRRLREVVRDENIVVAYLEAQGRSWPAWKTKHADFRTLDPLVLKSVASQLPNPPAAIELSSHSGGGSFIFGYLDSVDAIPAAIRRISLLDSNYGYSDESSHGDKLVAWLKADRDRYLGVICYDDREVLLDGKHIVGPQGGTWRATERMLARLKKDIALTEVSTEGLKRYRGLDGRIDIIMHPNPQNKILHTVLVGDMNGFIHAATFGTKYENKAATFNGGVAYSKWIQVGE